MTEVTLLSGGRRHRCVIETDASRLVFSKAPFSLKNEIKAMSGSKWDPERKRWSVSGNPRNLFQIHHMMKEPVDMNPYEPFEQPLEPLVGPVTRPLRAHQLEMIQKCITFRYQLLAAEMGLGKSLVAIEVWERLAAQYGWTAEDVAAKVWFVGPKSALESVELDMYKWDVKLKPTLMTYERFVIDSDPLEPPQVIFFDESSSLKTPSSLRARKAQSVTDAIRRDFGFSGCVVLMSGTVTAKRPSDIWSQAEITWPGFVREGSLKSFEDRYAIVVQGADADGNTFKKIEGWKDEEVACIPARLAGLLSVYRKDDYVKLPLRTFSEAVCEQTKRIKRIATAIVDAAPNVISGLTALRALSSGFQYDLDGNDDEDGERALVETLCPKDDVLRGILSEEESRGRIIVGASFQGSVDRAKRICLADGWDVITIDGRGWNCYTSDGERVKDHVLDFWANNSNRTALIGNPASCRFGLTLVEAKTTVVFDQNFSAEHRLQFLDRNYRIGQTEETRVVDIIHLPVDRLILQTLTENRRLEELSLGDLRESLQ